MSETADQGVTTPEGVISSEALEEAFDSVVGKMKTLHQELPEEEQKAFLGLLEAAREHADTVQARDEGELSKIVYEKPIQVHTTYAMKKKMKEIPRLLAE